jgi:predicted nucleotidyltransferase
MVDQGILDTVKQYVMLIPKEIGVKKAYLFGSFARGKEREESDIDVAVIV